MIKLRAWSCQQSFPDISLGLEAYIKSEPTSDLPPPLPPPPLLFISKGTAREWEHRRPTLSDALDAHAAGALLHLMIRNACQTEMPELTCTAA